MKFSGQENTDASSGISSNASCGHCALSEVIGSFILIGIVVAAVSIIGVVLWSQPPPHKLPSLSAVITNQSCTVFVNHDGGDLLERQSFRILVDGINQTENFTKRGASGAWTTWEIGDTLVYNSLTCSRMPERVDIVFDDGTSSYVITTAFFGSFSSSGVTPTVTATATPVPPPAADFSANPLVGTVPLPVSFTDTSTGSPTTWNWTFGDIGAGNISTLQNPPHTYTSAGTYSVTLTVSNAGGSSTLIKANYITVNPPAPVANFTGTPVSGAPPLAVSFTDTSTGSPTGWIWTFGDIGAGNTSTLQNPSHTYTTAGTYSVTLTVSNAGGSNTLIKTNYITVVTPPVANFTGTPTSGPAPLLVVFTDTSTGSPTGWNWTFGDIGAGNTSTVQNPSHTYTTAGTYSVNLTVSNAGGSNTLIRTNYIYVPVCFSDNFNDNILGSAWTTMRGTWTESGGVLSQTSTASADPKKAIISNSGLNFGSNLTITAKVRINSWIDGDMARGGVSLFTNTADGNGYNLLFHNNHNTVQWLNDKVAWYTSYTYTFTNGNWYWFKMKMDSGTLYGKIWLDGTAEPSNWPYSYTISGRTGYPALNGGSSNGAVYATVSFDDVLVCSN
jgi:PKD repeat protein